MTRAEYDAMVADDAAWEAAQERADLRAYPKTHNGARDPGQTLEEYKRQTAREEITQQRECHHE